MEPELILVDEAAIASLPQLDDNLDDDEHADADEAEPELLVVDDLDGPSFEEFDTEPPLPPGPDAETESDPSGHPAWAGVVATGTGFEAAGSAAEHETTLYDYDEDFEVAEPEPVTASASDLGAGFAPYAWPEDDVEEPAEAGDWERTEVAPALDTAPAVGPDPGLRPPDAQPADAEPEADADAAAQPTRGRVRVAILALACAVVLLGAGLGASRALHHSTTPASRSQAARPASTGQPHTTVPAESAALAAARLQTATDEADSATTTAMAGLSTLSGFPTPTNVAAVVNPYVASLLLYQAYLSGATVPASARQATAAASEQIRNDLTFLDTINGLPSIQLGSFIDQFRGDTQQLQAALGTIEHELSASGHS